MVFLDQSSRVLLIEVCTCVFIISLFAFAEYAWCDFSLFLGLFVNVLLCYVLCSVRDLFFLVSEFLSVILCACAHA